MKRFVVAVLFSHCLMISAAWADPPCRFFQRRSVPMPAPLGTYLNGWNDAQAAAAEADQFVIYRQEWYLDGVKLGPYGSYHLQRITKRLPYVPFQVIIEPDLHNDKVNQARKLLVVNELLAAGIMDAQTRVVVAYPRAEGLYGEEAVRIYLQRFSGNRGGSSGSSGTTGGGITMPGGGLGGGYR